MKYLQIIILSGIILAGCTKDNSLSPGNINLSGNWKWIESSGGIDGRIDNPTTSGDSIVLQFSNDSVVKFVNDSLYFSMTYFIEIDESIYGGEKNIIVYENGFSQSIELDNKQLILSDECIDCFINKYIKE